MKIYSKKCGFQNLLFILYVKSIVAVDNLLIKSVETKKKFQKNVTVWCAILLKYMLCTPNLTNQVTFLTKLLFCNVSVLHQ